MTAPTDRTWALAEARKHLTQLREDGADAAEGWAIDDSELDSKLVLWVEMPAKRRDGSLHADGMYLQRLEFSHYPTYPPTIEFATSKREVTGKAMPKLTAAPPGQGVQFHENYDGRGQLVCHSLNFEYYIRGGHNPGPDVHWKEGLHTFVTTLLFHQRLLTEPYYGGRRP